MGANPEETQRILSKSCKKVLGAPIVKSEFEWFKKYVNPSSIWMQRTKDGQFMFEWMMKITRSMSEKVDNSMDSILEHLQQHKEWPKVLAFKNESVVTRQDDDRVGLLKDQGIRDVVDLKQDDNE